MAQSSASIPTEKLVAHRQEHIGRLFLRAHRDFSERAIEKLHSRGHSRLTLAHTALLVHLDVEGTHITVLAERAGMTRQSMGQLVRELAECGYVERTPDADDQRAIVVVFTESGRRFLEDAYLVKQEIEGEYAAVIGEESLAVLRSLLGRIVPGRETA